MSRRFSPPYSLRHHPQGDALAELVETTLAAVDPQAATARALSCTKDALHFGAHRIPLAPSAKVWLLAVGKAAHAMVRAAIPVLNDRIAEALVITKHHCAPSLGGSHRMRIMVADHPVPSARSMRAGRAALAFAQRPAPEDVLVVLLSGGTSALAVAPIEGLDLADLVAQHQRLLASGADITAINAERGRHDRLKAGGLRRAATTTNIATLVLSDVVDGPVSVVGSGPTAGGPMAEVANNATAIHAAIEAARPLGWHVERWAPLCGEAHTVGTTLGRYLGAAVVRQPTLYIAGGETTVTLPTDHGLGGRNQELALAAAVALGVSQPPDRLLLSIATDGEDGPTTVAGAVVTNTSLRRALDLGLDPQSCLRRHDSHSFFRALDDHLVTGPTGTNVCDLVLGFASP